MTFSFIKSLAVVLSFMECSISYSEDYSAKYLLSHADKYLAEPITGELQGWGKYSIGQSLVAVTGAWTGDICDWGQGGEYPAQLSSPEIAARILVMGREIGGKRFSVESFYQANELIYVAEGYREIIKISQGTDPTRSNITLSKTSGQVEGMPIINGLLLPPGGVVSTWDGGGYLQKIRMSPDSPKMEAVIEFWDKIVRPLGYLPPDRQLILKTGDEFKVNVTFRAAQGNVSATAVGVIRCTGIYPPIPDKGFRGGIGLLPIELKISKVK